MKGEGFNVILDYISVHGEPSSKFCFLTIEEGGGTSLDDYKAILKEVSNHPLQVQSRERGNWSVDAYDNLYQALGQPGIKICKVMAALHGFDDWRMYAKEKLYGNNEQNVRFFPLSRRSIHDQSFFGQNTASYEKVCREKRPDVFLKCQEIFNSKRFYIITAKYVEKQWRKVLEGLFSHVVYKTEYLSVDKDKKFPLDVALSEGRPVYLTFSLFKQGVSDEVINAFSAWLGRFK